MIFKTRFLNALIFSFFLIFIPFPLCAATFYVDDASGNDGWGGSSESPFATIQQAVDSASTGDEIRVAQGTYTGISAIDPDGSGETYYQVVFIRNKSLTLRGGYNTSNWTTSDPVTNITTIDAGESGRCITIRNSVTPHTVTIDGFTITGGDYTDLGNADGSANSECGRTSSDCGGGLYAYYVTLILKNSTVTGNNASSTSVSSDGGGIYLYNCRPGNEIENVEVSNNLAPTSSSEGGGLQINGGYDVTIKNCTFINNYSQDGGAISIFHPSGTVIIEDTHFSGNTTFYNGGAILAKLTYTAETALYVNRGNFVNNEAKSGACIALNKHGSDTTSVYINNLILNNNTSSSTGDDNSLVYVNSGATIDVFLNHLTADDNSATSFLYATTYADAGETTFVTVNNTIVDSFTNAFSGNETYGATTYDANVVVNYNNALLNNITNLTHNFGGTPIFNAGESIFADPKLDSTYHLLAGSPAINAGMNAGVTTDIDGDARPKGSGYDIGADEFYARTLSGIIMMLLN